MIDTTRETPTVADGMDAHPDPVSHGWVMVRPGFLRPAYVRQGRPVVYSPENAGAWVDAPSLVADTYFEQWNTADGWRPLDRDAIIAALGTDRVLS